MKAAAFGRMSHVDMGVQRGRYLPSLIHVGDPLVTHGYCVTVGL